MKLSEKARIFAIEAHDKESNHRYSDDLPYSYHLQKVVEAATQYMDTTLPPEEQEIILAAAWCHDIIEDARLSYNDIRKALGVYVAEIAFALTNEKGRNRLERANDRYYYGIRNTIHATYVKLCDRIANVSHSKQSQSGMFEKYKKENPEFIQKLDPQGHDLKWWKY